MPRWSLQKHYTEHFFSSGSWKLKNSLQLRHRALRNTPTLWLQSAVVLFWHSMHHNWWAKHGYIRNHGVCSKLNIRIERGPCVCTIDTSILYPERSPEVKRGRQGHSALTCTVVEKHYTGEPVQCRATGACKFLQPFHARTLEKTPLPTDLWICCCRQLNTQAGSLNGTPPTNCRPVTKCSVPYESS